MNLIIDYYYNQFIFLGCWKEAEQTINSNHNNKLSYQTRCLDTSEHTEFFGHTAFVLFFGGLVVALTLSFSRSSSRIQMSSEDYHLLMLCSANTSISPTHYYCWKLDVCNRLITVITCFTRQQNSIMLSFTWTYSLFKSHYYICRSILLIQLLLTISR